MKLSIEDALEQTRRARGVPDLLALARSFPTLEETPREFFRVAGNEDFAFSKGAIRFTDDGARDFARWAATGGGGQIDAALFILSVWSSSTDWGDECGLRRDDGPTGGRFDVHRALGNWDNGHRAAFIAWAKAPFWM